MKQQLVRAERADGARSRRAILDAATKLATLEGLNGLSIGRLAEHIGMSKSGLYAHFGSKEELQLAAVETAAEILEAEVVRPAQSVREPLAHVGALCERFMDYVGRRVFPGGCFFAAAVAEFDTHPGPVKDRIAEVYRGWLLTLEAPFRRAQEQGELDEREDPAQLAFELDAYLLMANMNFVLFDDPSALARGLRAVRDRINRARAS